MPEAVKETVSEKAKEDIIEKVPCKEVTQVEEVAEKTDVEVKGDSVEEGVSSEASQKAEDAPTAEGNGTASQVEEKPQEKSTNGTTTPKEPAETHEVDGTKLGEASSNSPNVEKVEDKSGESNENVHSVGGEEKPSEVKMEISHNEGEKPAVESVSGETSSEGAPEQTSIEAAPEKISEESASSEKISEEAPSEKTSAPSENASSTPDEAPKEASTDIDVASESKQDTCKAGEAKESSDEAKLKSQVNNEMETDETPKTSDDKSESEDKKTPTMEVEEMETDSAPAESAPSSTMETDGQVCGKPVQTENDTTSGQESAKSVGNDIVSSCENKTEAEKPQPVEETPKTDETPAPASSEIEKKPESSDADAMEVDGSSSSIPKEASDNKETSEPKSEASGDDSKESANNVEKSKEVSNDETSEAPKSNNDNQVALSVCEGGDKKETESTDIPSVEAEKSEDDSKLEKSETPMKPDEGKTETKENEEKQVEPMEESSSSEDKSAQKPSEKTSEEPEKKEIVKENDSSSADKADDKTEKDVANQSEGGDGKSVTSEQKALSSKELTALINPPYKPPQIPKDQDNSNQSDAGAGGSREIDPKVVSEVKSLITEGKSLMKANDYFTAADTLGKACEIAGKLYGDLAVENAELFYLYGCAMLECAKNENPVLGEGVKEQEEAEEDVEENEENTVGEGNEETNADEEMEVENGDAAETENGEAAETENGDGKEESEKTEENGVEEDAGEATKEGEEDDDSSLKVAWDMFELAKHLFQKLGDDLRLSDTYIKLGEVSVESGHSSAIEDMKNALEIRKKCASDNERLIAETHFHIGLAYATFQSFDEAIEAFKVSKSMIQDKLEKLKEANSDASSAEIKELSELIPDLDEKIQDMEDSKKVKANAEEGLAKENGGDKPLGEASAGSSKEVSNISHLVKRKRKLEEVASDLLPNSKQPCTETTPETEPAPPAPMEESN